MVTNDRKIIAVGDYLKKKKSIIDVEVLDPENPKESVYIQFLIQKPSPKDTLIIMEFVNHRMSHLLEDDKSEIKEKDIRAMTSEDRTEAINLVYAYDATLISSCVFKPQPGEDGRPVKVWETSDDVLADNTIELFEKLRAIVGSQKVVISEGEASK